MPKRVLATGIRKGDVLVIQEVERRFRTHFKVIVYCFACRGVKAMHKSVINRDSRMLISCGCKAKNVLRSSISQAIALRKAENKKNGKVQ